MPRKLLIRLKSVDFSPELSRKARKWLATPLALLLLAAGVAVLSGLVIHPRVFALAGGLLAIAAAGVCWPWLTMRGVRATVAFDRPRSTENVEVGVTATVTNHLPWASWGLLVRDGAGSLNAKLPRIASRAKSVCRWVIVPPVRGVYPIGQPSLCTGFPFGLRESKRACTVTSQLIVWPRTFPVGPVPSSEGADVVEGNVTRNKVGSMGDVLGVRPYRRGDSPRRIHWAQSARHDRLIVCELQSNSRPVVILVLDANPAIHTLGHDGSREWAIRVVGSLAKGWLDTGAQVGLMVGKTYLAPLAGADHSNRILDALSAITPDSVPLYEVLNDPRLRNNSGIKVVVTTDVGRSVIPPSDREVKWVILEQVGFGGSAAPANSSINPRPWLTLPSPESIPDQLRHGTGEASHGS